MVQSQVAFRNFLALDREIVAASSNSIIVILALALAHETSSNPDKTFREFLALNGIIQDRIFKSNAVGLALALTHLLGPTPRTLIKFLAFKDNITSLSGKKSPK